MKQPAENPRPSAPLAPIVLERGFLHGDNAKLSKETLSALEDLGDVLKSIRKRMLAEGYEIRDGAMCKPDAKCV